MNGIQQDMTPEEKYASAMSLKVLELLEANARMDSRLNTMHKANMLMLEQLKNQDLLHKQLGQQLLDVNDRLQKLEP